MKPFAAIDLTTDKKNTTVNGMEFCVAKPAEPLASSYESISQQISDLRRQAKLPLPLQIIQFTCFYLWLGTFIGLLKGLAGAENLDIIYQNIPWAFWLWGSTFLVWLVLKILSHLRKAAILEAESSKQLLVRLENLSSSIFTDLSVPANARQTDALSFFYKDNKGKVKFITKSLQPYHFLNLVYYAYADEENLYLANPVGKFAFPKASMKAIRRVKKNMLLSAWNKEASPDEGFYKQFRLQINQYGGVLIRRYYILELEQDGKTWGIYFPSYELPTFEVLTGLKAK